MNPKQKLVHKHGIASRMPALLVASLLIPSMAILISGSARGDMVVFSEDFSSDPDTTGQWRVYRHAPDPDNEASWDSGTGTLYLTRAAEGKASAIFANYELTARTWVATFDYKVGGGSGGDGFTFMFYKDETEYRTLAPAPGNKVGFVTTARGMDGSGDAALAPALGYGIEFRTYGGPDIALIKDRPEIRLAAAPTTTISGNAWHTATVQFDAGNVAVAIDGASVLTTSLAAVDYTFTGIGFSAGEGGATNNHIIDNFQLSVSAVSLPGAPQRVKALPDPAKGQVVLTWDSPASNGGSQVTNYYVYRADGTGSAAFLADIAASPTPRYEDATCDGLCVYTVSAKNSAGEGPQSMPAPGISAIKRTGSSGMLSPPHVLYDAENLTIVPGADLPPQNLGQDVVTVTICDSESITVGCVPGATLPYLCVNLTLRAPPTPTTVTLTCVNRGNLGQADPLIPRGSRSLLTVGAGSLGTTPHLTLTANASFTYAPSHVVPGLVALGSPIFWQPFLTNPEDAQWFLTHGDDTGLKVAVRVYENGEERQAETFSIPWIGQVIAAADMTAGMPP